MRYLFIRTLIVVVFFAFVQPGYAAFIQLKNFGENPGELSASFYHEKEKLPATALVVLLHGCGQNGERFARQSGFLAQAKQHRFNLLIPQQSTNNHSKLCFNWYNKSDHQKNVGESLSLKNMITAVKAITGAEKVYIAGLSAGGAMASIMLFHYPELFDGGAIVAGLPYPCAEDLPQALACMKNGPAKKFVNYQQQKVVPREWPRLTIWTGTQDKIVNPINAKSIAQQWVALTGAKLKSSKTAKEMFDVQASSGDKKASTEVIISDWYNKSDGIQVQLVEIGNMGHGMPVIPKIEGAGISGDYLLATPLSAALMIPRFWRLY